MDGKRSLSRAVKRDDEFVCFPWYSSEESLLHGIPMRLHFLFLLLFGRIQLTSTRVESCYARSRTANVFVAIDDK